VSWINDLVTQHSELESPRSFWYWSGLCAISAVVKDRIWIPRTKWWNTYPNIYVMLHAGSGLKKGPPVALARKLVHRVNNTRIIVGRASIQGVLKELGTAQTKPGGKLESDSSCFYCAGEFSSSLVADPAAMVILTELYDRSYNEGEYRSLLKMESFKLMNPCVSLLVATNQAHFDDFVAQKDIQGGFVARTFIIAESKVHRRNPLIRPMEVEPDVDELSSYLKEIAKLEGPFEPFYDKPAGNLYEEWYMSFYEEMDKSGIEDPTGTVQRVGDAALKVAMLLSMSDSPELKLSRDNIETAIAACEKLLGGMRKVTHGSEGLSPTVHQKKLIIKRLLKEPTHQFTRKQFLSTNWVHFEEDQLAACTNTLEEAGILVIEDAGNEVSYRMPDKQVKEWLHFLKEDE